MMAVVLAFEEDALRSTCGYAPQSEKCLEEERKFRLDQ